MESITQHNKKSKLMLMRRATASVSKDKARLYNRSGCQQVSTIVKHHQTCPHTQKICDKTVSKDPMIPTSSSSSGQYKPDTEREHDKNI